VNVTVVVPVARDGAERDQAWAFCRGRYPDGWTIIEAEPPPGPWSKGEHVNEALRAAGGDVVIVADCDVWVEACYLETAAGAALRRPWVIPHGIVYRLSAHQTRWEIGRPATVPRPIHTRSHRGPAGGGIVVARPEAWDAVRGYDPRFVGWGGEDISLARAFDTLAGRGVCLQAPLWHFWHRPLPRAPGRRAHAANEALAARYADADGDPAAMSALVAEHD